MAHDAGIDTLTAQGGDAETPLPEVEHDTGPLVPPTPDTGFAIDPVLFEILKPEVAGHLETIDAWLAACAAGGPQPVSDPLLRSVHTMNGAFAMTEVTALTDGLTDEPLL